MSASTSFFSASSFGFDAMAALLVGGGVLCRPAVSPTTSNELNPIVRSIVILFMGLSRPRKYNHRGAENTERFCHRDAQSPRRSTRRREAAAQASKTVIQTTAHNRPSFGSRLCWPERAACFAGRPRRALQDVVLCASVPPWLIFFFLVRVFSVSW